MRFVRAFAGMLLLIIGLPALLAGGTLWLVIRHADPSGAFTARFETVQTTGHAMVVTDLDRLLRREAPFTRLGQTRLRIEARTPDGPAFLGLAPADEARRWLEPVPHATVRRVALARGPLPVRLDPAGTAPSAGTPAAGLAPTDRPRWVREGVGAIEWTPDELAGRPLSLVVTRPDGGPNLTLDLRAEFRAGWMAPAMWGLLAGGVLLVTFAVLLLFRPVRPREVIFVVEPDQVPVLAGRLGVSSLSGLGAQPRSADDRAVMTQRQLAAVGSGPPERSAIGAVPAGRPASLADLVGDERAGAEAGHGAVGSAAPAAASPPGVSLTLAWPPAQPERTVRPVPLNGDADPVDGRPA
ncbi:hypothetical protein D7193_05685 [Micromonospora costi]|uniref:Uncharacterized protein n=1 Tax=Micromonospora costi TaxID=1530042 RepID=A0A3B0AC08_9ACTN|nr:hypothetical protein [Micromonospora costi]RKN58085.1 hypothetical protein D7193_05685 [Micromonospora costi]